MDARGDAALSCQAVTELVTDEHEGALSDATRRRFEEHMSICEGCRAFESQIEHIVAALRTLPREAAPAALKGHLLCAFRGRRRGDGE